MKTLIIGRHSADFPAEIEVCRQENINFPASANECRQMLKNIAADAIDEGIEAIVFQAIPNQVAMALPSTTFFSLKVGAIINRPAERLAGVSKDFYAYEPMHGIDWRGDIEEAVLFANPRAKVSRDPTVGISINVDPPLRFEFSHIEWLNSDMEMKIVNDYPWNCGDCYEVANWLNDAERYGHPLYNDSVEAAKAHKLMAAAGWTFLTYNDHGQEVWQKPGTEARLDGSGLAIKE